MIILRSKFERMRKVPVVSSDIDYDQTGPLLDASPLSPTVSEAHGMLCGFICFCALDPIDVWLAEVLPMTDAADLLLNEARDSLRALASRTHARMSGPGLEFGLFLPDDERPLEERAIALYDWIRGYLYAFGVMGVPEQDLTGQEREILGDFTQLTRMDLDHLEATEQNEEALTEVTEFIRMAVLLMHESRTVGVEGAEPQ